MLAISLAIPPPTVASGCRSSWRRISSSRSASARQSRSQISRSTGILSAAGRTRGGEPVGPMGILPVDHNDKEPGKMPGLPTARTAVLRASSLKFTHFSATTSSGKKQRGIPAAGCGS